MKLTVLGSGTAVSGFERAAPGFALDLGKEIIVIDLGFGCFKNMQKAGIAYEKVNNLFFTHFEHPDHINDLSAFLFARKVSVYLKKSKPTQINLFGGPGFKKFVEKLAEAYPSIKNLLFKLNVSELDSFETKKLTGYSLLTKPMQHVPSSLGYRFQAGNKSVVFSGDTAPNENIVELAKGSDLLVAECSYAEKQTADHLSALNVADIASRVGTKAVLLNHMYPEAEKSDLASLVGKKFKGKVYVSQDLMEVDV